MNNHFLTPHRIVGWTLCMFLCGLLLFSRIIPIADNVSLQLIRLSIATIAAAALAIVVYRNTQKTRIKQVFRFNKISFQAVVFMLILGVCLQGLAMLINIPVNIILSKFTTLKPPSMPVPQNGWEFALGFVCLGVVPAIFEELLFRGIAIHEYEKYSQKTAIIITAICFAIMHRNLYSFIPTLFLGAVLAVIVLRTNSIFSSMLIHFAFNCTASVISYFIGRIADAETMAIASGVLLVYAFACLPVFGLMLWWFKKTFKLAGHTPSDLQNLAATALEESTPTNKKPLFGFSLGFALCVVIIVANEIL